MIPVYQGVEAVVQLQRIQQQTMQSENATIYETVKNIIEQVRDGGDAALCQFCEEFGDPILDGFILSPAQVQTAVEQVPTETRELLHRAAQNIRMFGEAIMRSVQPSRLTHDGFSVGLDWRPVERVACYAPGGRYPLPSTALMTAITAQVAGVPEICIVSPDLQPATVYAGILAGVTQFYSLGGAQAVAALAYGTASISTVDMLVGPGNAYVTEAKRQLQGIIGIDMLAGPSEVAIIADAQAKPEWVALDLLAQAEHDPNARAYLLTDSPSLAEQTQQALQAMIRQHPNLPAYLRESADWGSIFVLRSIPHCIDSVNTLAPEHLELLVVDPLSLKESLKHYGTLFMGYHTPVPVGDYMAGPNHTLPTGRTARFSGALNPMTFLRPQGWIHTSAETTSLLADTRNFAQLEGLTAHALSAGCRIDNLDL